MKLLISPKNKKEAIETILGGADIIDVKNPSEGPLGANFPWIIKDIIEIVPKNIETSCTIGEMSNCPGSISLAARGAATIGVNYIKAGLAGLKKTEDAIDFMINIVRSIKDYNSKIKVVITGYADAEKIGSINPLMIPKIAFKTKADVAMIDTAIKDGNSLFHYLSEKQLNNFVHESHKYKLITALAGSLKKEELSKIKTIGSDIIGIRGAACSFGDRINGQITRKKVTEIADYLSDLKS